MSTVQSSGMSPNTPDLRQGKNLQAISTEEADWLPFPMEKVWLTALKPMGGGRWTPEFYFGVDDMPVQNRQYGVR